MSPHPCQHLLLSFFVIAILVEVKWYLIMIWVIISSVAKDIMGNFSCAYWPFVSLYGEMSISILGLFFNQVFFLLLSFLGFFK